MPPQRPPGRGKDENGFVAIPAWKWLLMTFASVLFVLQYGRWLESLLGLPHWIQAVTLLQGITIDETLAKCRTPWQRAAVIVPAMAATATFLFLMERLLGDG